MGVRFDRKGSRTYLQSGEFSTKFLLVTQTCEQVLVGPSDSAILSLLFLHPACPREVVGSKSSVIRTVLTVRKRPSCESEQEKRKLGS